jgi:SNF2 family DNA or RNA helicase
MTVSGAASLAGMGTGKTSVACGLIVNGGFMRTLVVQPKKAITTHVWAKEFATAFPDKVKVVELVKKNGGGTAYATRLLKEELEQQPYDGVPRVFCITYAGVWREQLANAILAADFQCAICDESHKIKGPGSKCSMFLGDLSNHVPYRLGMTGTPMPHDPSDVYAQYRFIDKGIFGTDIGRFRRRYATMELDEAGYRHYYFTEENKEDLSRRMYSIAFRVEDTVLDLPEEIDIEEKFTLSSIGAKYYDAISNKSSVELQLTDGENASVSTTIILTELLRHAQITSGFLPYGSNDRLDQDTVSALIECGLDIPAPAPSGIVIVDTGKRELLKDVLDDLTNDLSTNPPKFEPAVIFYRFKQDAKVIKEVCAELGRTCAECSGNLDQTEEWQNGEFDDICVQIGAGSESINLTRSCYGIYYSVDFNYGSYSQSRRRINRPGQTRPVRFIHLIAEDTVDEDTYAVLNERAETQTTIIDVIRQRRLAMQNAA